MARRLSRCRCCLRPSGGSTFCQGCSEARSRTLFGVRSLIIALWGYDGLHGSRLLSGPAGLTFPALPGRAVGMTAVTTESDRERELAELTRLLSERGQQRPAPVPVALHKIADTMRRTP